MKVYIVIERCEDSYMDFNPIKNVYSSREDAKEHLAELVEYFDSGLVLDDEEFEFYDEDTGYYVGIEEWTVT
jgi:hypothetical protein